MGDYPKLQLALDVAELDPVLDVCKKASDEIDIIEVGTLLCLSEGMSAVRKIKELFPQHILLADIRIIKAGGVIADLAFSAGADWVSVMSDASIETIEAVVKSAEKHGGDVQIELNDNWTLEQARMWRKLGIKQVIFHRASELKDMADEDWGSDVFSVIKKLSQMGFKVTITGGVTPEDIKLFEDVPVYIFIAGRAIRTAQDPKSAAKTFKESIKQVYSK